MIVHDVKMKFLIWKAKLYHALGIWPKERAQVNKE